MITLESVKRFIDRFYLKVSGYIDWFLVPLENNVLNWYAQKCPQRFWDHLESCIEKGLQYFETQPVFILDAIFVFTVIVSEKLEPRLSRLEQKMRKYSKEWKDPHLRLLDRNYDPERDGVSCSNTFDVEQLSDHEKPMLDCLYADRLGLQEDFLDKLSTFDDNGGCGTTHVLLGCVILKAFSGIPHEAINPIIKSTIAPIVRVQQHARVEDLSTERTVLLQWLGYDQYIQPAWIYRILRGQMSNGAWYEDRSLFRQPADQHPTSLALAALIQYREKHLKNKANPSISPIEKLGRALSCSTVTKANDY